MREFIGSLARWVKRILLGTLAFAVIYVCAATAFVMFPQNGRTIIADDEPPIWLCAGWIHADIAVPVSQITPETYGDVAGMVPAGSDANDFAIIGWGNHIFFDKEQRMRALRPDLLFGAVTNQHDTALRLFVKPESELEDYHCRPIPMDADGRAALALHVRDTPSQPPAPFPPDSDGERYLSTTRPYHLFTNSNGWVADALEAAGHPNAHFAPFAYSITWPMADRKLE